MRYKIIEIGKLKIGVAISFSKDYTQVIETLKNNYISKNSLTAEQTGIIAYRNVSEEYKERGALQMKYTQEIKDQCVELVKQGKSFAYIKAELGPNPKAVQRYLAKAGVDYKELKASLMPETNEKAKGKKKGGRKAKTTEEVEASLPHEEVIEE